MDVDVDVREVRTLAVRLGVDTVQVVAAARVALQQASQVIKERMQVEARSTGRTRHFSRSITYETRVTALGVEAEIGPDKNLTQGALGNLLYFGTARSGPVLPNPGLALDRAAPRLEDALGTLAAKALL